MNPLVSPVGAYRRPRHRGLVVAKLDSPSGAIGRSVAVVTFAALLTATIALNSFKIGGFPIRGIVAAGALILAILFYVDVARLVLRRHLLLLGLAAGLAMCFAGLAGVVMVASAAGSSSRRKYEIVSCN